MSHELHFPLTASTWALVVVFLGTSLLLHLLFVILWKPGKLFWKWMEYPWLLAATLGLAAAASDVRSFFARPALIMERNHVTYDYELLRDRLRFLSGPAVCRQFTKTEFSPPNFDEIQNEYNLVCEISRDLYAAWPSAPPDDIAAISIDKLPNPRSRSLAEAVEEVHKQRRVYAGVLKQIAALQAAAEKRDRDPFTAVSGPFLLAIALALRFTKATGELRLERNNTYQQQPELGGEGRRAGAAKDVQALEDISSGGKGEAGETAEHSGGILPHQAGEPRDPSDEARLSESRMGGKSSE